MKYKTNKKRHKRHTCFNHINENTNISSVQSKEPFLRFHALTFFSAFCLVQIKMRFFGRSSRSDIWPLRCSTAQSVQSLSVRVHCIALYMAGKYYIIINIIIYFKLHILAVEQYTHSRDRVRVLRSSIKS